MHSAAHTQVQRALHSLLLDDESGAAFYLKQALRSLEESSAQKRRGIERFIKTGTFGSNPV
jgi:hypothetical protein